MNNSNIEQEETNRPSNLEEYFEPIEQVNDPRFGQITILRNKYNEEDLIFAKEKLSHNLHDCERDIFQAKERMRLSHEFLLKMVDFSTRTFQSEEDPDRKEYLVSGFYEYPGHDLATEISERQEQQRYFTAQELLHLEENILEVLNYLRSFKMIHGDIRPKYIFFDYTGNNLHKLVDRLGDPSPPNQVQINNIKRKEPLYMSPALYRALMHKEKKIKHNPYKSDAFSLGLVMLEAGTLKSVQDIYKDKDIDVDLFLELVEEFVAFYEHSKLLKESVMYLLDIDEKERKDPKRILKFFKDFRLEEQEEEEAPANLSHSLNSPRNLEVQELKLPDSSNTSPKMQNTGFQFNNNTAKDNTIEAVEITAELAKKRQVASGSDAEAQAVTKSENEDVICEEVEIERPVSKHPAQHFDKSQLKFDFEKPPVVETVNEEVEFERPVSKHPAHYIDKSHLKFDFEKPPVVETVNENAVEEERVDDVRFEQNNARVVNKQKVLEEEGDKNVEQEQGNKGFEIQENLEEFTVPQAKHPAHYFDKSGLKFDFIHDPLVIQDSDNQTSEVEVENQFTQQNKRTVTTHSTQYNQNANQAQENAVTIQEKPKSSDINIQSNNYQSINQGAVRSNTINTEVQTSSPVIPQNTQQTSFNFTNILPPQKSGKDISVTWESSIHRQEPKPYQQATPLEPNRVPVESPEKNLINDNQLSQNQRHSEETIKTATFARNSSQWQQNTAFASPNQPEEKYQGITHSSYKITQNPTSTRLNKFEDFEHKHNSAPIATNLLATTSSTTSNQVFTRLGENTEQSESRTVFANSRFSNQEKTPVAVAKSDTIPKTPIVRADDQNSRQPQADVLTAQTSTRIISGDQLSKLYNQSEGLSRTGNYHSQVEYKTVHAQSNITNPLNYQSTRDNTVHNYEAKPMSSGLSFQNFQSQPLNYTSVARNEPQDLSRAPNQPNQQKSQPQSITFVNSTFNSGIPVQRYNPAKPNQNIQENIPSNVVYRVTTDGKVVQGTSSTPGYTRTAFDLETTANSALNKQVTSSPITFSNTIQSHKSSESHIQTQQPQIVNPSKIITFDSNSRSNISNQQPAQAHSEPNATTQTTFQTSNQSSSNFTNYPQNSEIRSTRIIARNVEPHNNEVSILKPEATVFSGTSNMRGSIFEDSGNVQTRELYVNKDNFQSIKTQSRVTYDSRLGEKTEPSDVNTYDYQILEGDNGSKRYILKRNPSQSVLQRQPQRSPNGVNNFSQIQHNTFSSNRFVDSGIAQQQPQVNRNTFIPSQEELCHINDKELANRYNRAQLREDNNNYKVYRVVTSKTELNDSSFGHCQPLPVCVMGQQVSQSITYSGNQTRPSANFVNALLPGLNGRSNI